MLEHAAIVPAKVAAIDYRSAVRNVGVVVIDHHSATPIRLPIVIAPAIVAKQSQGNADGGKSDSDTYRKTYRRRRYIKASIGRNPPTVDPPGVVVRHVHDFGIYGNNFDQTAVVHHALLGRIS